MGNGHSAIDRLIALTTLQKYQEGGEVSPTWGEKFVKMFPSKHKDPERAAEQQRALTGLIDFFAAALPAFVYENFFLPTLGMITPNQFNIIYYSTPAYLLRILPNLLIEMHFLQLDLIQRL